jgi:hypothetical protein
MTRGELLTLLGVRIQDTAAVRWDGTQQPDALNLTYEDFCARTECVQGLTTLVQSSGAVYVPAGGGTAPRIVRLTGEPQSATLRRRLCPITADQAFDMDPAWETREQDPDYYIFPWTQAAGVKTLRVVFTPSAALTDLKVPAVLLPAQMTADADVPAIPPECHDCLVDGAAAYLLTQPGRMQNMDLAGVYAGRYEAKVAAMAGMNVTSFSNRGAHVPYRNF